MQVANTFAAATTPAGVGGPALSTRFLQTDGLGTLLATTAVALQQSVQVITHIGLLIFFSTAIGASADLSHFVPSTTVLYLIAGVALGYRQVHVRAEAATVAGDGRAAEAERGDWPPGGAGPRTEAAGVDRIMLRRNDSRRRTSAVGQHRSVRRRYLVRDGDCGDDGRRNPRLSGPTPGGVGAVEAALIGGLAAFGVPAAIGWPIMLWLTKNEMI
jgi:hypothetical protein